MSAAPDVAPVSSDLLLLEQHGATLVITINRPEVKNAVNLALAIEIAAAMDHLDSRPDLTVGVLTGAGSTFCAGMDLKAFLAGERPSLPGRGFAGLVEQPPAKPLIAAVEGYALAGGFEIALACDLVIASRTAVFGLPEVKRSLVAAGGGLLRLPARIPYHLAMEWALTGRLVPAEEAHDARLVSRITEPGEALAQALELAGTIAENGPLAVRATKQILSSARDWPSNEAFDRQREISEPVRSSADAREGATAFRERRTPVWRGR
ncbi:crotonase/enoyl-CoA hydratase family protein [Nocardioides sediminis]|uniref:crotonase/enoyl-CoA hydratase family protein n=1 Tax=Nocardioides sediminis TaxID=433648 RepID=UPI000D2FFB11|nr:crotonase/enoyl-CoA hydratase family protein [Nocardioides sediminis]